MATDIYIVTNFTSLVVVLFLVFYRTLAGPAQ